MPATTMMPLDRRAGALDSRALRHFVVTAEHGSVRSASEVLGLSQPGLSKSIRTLEQALNVQLFHRHPSGVELTPHGETLANQARQVIAALDNLERDVRQTGSLGHGVLRLGATPTAETILAPVLKDYVQRYPQVDITLEVGVPDKLAHKVERCELDFLVSNDETVPLTDGLKCRVLRRDKVGFCAAGSHALAGRRGIALEELHGSRLIMPFLTPRLLQWLDDRHLFSDSMELGKVMCNNYELIARLLQDGVAVSIAPRYVVEQLSPFFDLVTLDIDNVDYEVSLAYVIPATGLLSAPARRMLSMITSTKGVGAAN